MLPLNTGDMWSPEQADVSAWAAAYPAVNVSAELAKMAAWLTSNPKNRKTAAGIKRFCNSWLARAQDRGGASPSTFARPTTEVRAQKISIDLVDVSWVPSQLLESSKRYFLEKHGCYALDGTMYYN